MMAQTRSLSYRLYQVLRAHPLLDSPVVLTRLTHVAHHSGKRESVLSRSTLFLQDGISINELPILIRRLDKSLIPVSTNKLTLDDIQKSTQQDEEFRMKLQGCTSAKEVFKQLEIPAEQVTPYTAAFALDRLCQLQKARNNDLESIHSFIRHAVLKELCDTIVRGVATLTSDTLISMVHCAISTSLPEQTQVTLIVEAEKRLSDSRFTISQLCELLSLISSDDNLVDLVDNIHIHLGHRLEEMDSKNLVNVYESLSRRQCASTKTTLTSLEPVLLSCWWQLTNQDTAKILTSLVHLNHKSVSILSALGKLVFLNIQNFEIGELKRVVFAYIHFSFSNNYLFKALEKYAIAKGEAMETSVVALLMEYCRCCRHLSVPIFDATATHLKKHGHLYSGNELYLILRPLGQLNYLPTKAGPLFVKIESYLSDKFDELSTDKMIELLTSFAYVERFPINFVKKIFTPYTFSLVNNIADVDLRDAACRNLMKLQSAVKMEWKDCRLPYLYNFDSARDRWTDSYNYRILCDMKEQLRSLLPAYHVHQSQSLDKSPYIIDFIIEKKETSVVSVLPHDEVAVVVSTRRDFTTNTHTPLGDYAMKLRHIRHKDIGLIEIPQSLYSRSSDKELFLKNQIDRYVKRHGTS